MKTKLSQFIQDGKHCCKQCSKEIQYVTSNQQEFCSNTCRSRFNQLERAAVLRKQREQKVMTTPTHQQTVTHAAAPQHELPQDVALPIRYVPDMEKMSVENLCSLLDTVLAELAEEKAKATLLEKELVRFKRVAFNVYVAN